MPVTAPRGDDWAHEPTRFRRSLAWFMHHSSRLVIGLAVALFACNAVGYMLGHEKSTWLLIVTFVVVPVWVVALIESEWHALRWCEQCIWKRVQESGAEAAEEKRWQLRLFHLRYDNRAAALIVYLAFLAAICTTHGAVGALAFGAWVAWTVVCALADSAHSWHQLYCPWCRHGDGWDEHPVVDPVPDPSDSAPVSPQKVG